MHFPKIISTINMTNLFNVNVPNVSTTDFEQVNACWVSSCQCSLLSQFCPVSSVSVCIIWQGKRDEACFSISVGLLIPRTRGSD